MINHYFVHSSIAIFRLMGLLAFIVYKIIIIIIIINFTRSRRSEPQRARRVDQKRSIIDYALHASCIPLGSFPGCVGGAGYETSKVQCSYHHECRLGSTTHTNHVLRSNVHAQISIFLTWNTTMIVLILEVAFL